jgi:raffinose/stachyose/melibiose transport system permease protein
VSAASIAMRSPRARRWMRWSTAALFVLPALAVYAVLVLLPIAQAAFYSFFDWNGLKPLTDFVGLANYQRALSDPVFIGAITHNFLIIALSLTIQIPFALWLALVLNRDFPGRAVLRLLFFAPYVIAEVIAGIVFQLMLTPDGLVDQTLEAVGLGAFVQLWLADPAIVMSTLFVIISWKYFGFHMIIMLAGLQGIPREVEEAALVDGASRNQSVRHITLPLLGPAIRVSVFLSIIGALQLFDLVWATTKGGPINASNTMATYMIDWGFRRSELGYGSATAVILFVMAFIVALFYQRFVMRRDVEGAVTTGAEQA